MADHTTSLKSAMQIEGALGVALVDSSSGMALGTAGAPPDLDLDVAAAGNSTVVQAKLRTMETLGLDETIEDILITLAKQYHIIRPLVRHKQLFLYLVLDRARGNLALARFKLAEIESGLKV
jgi:predicted regulator of Ras-like GTPase activity (Roadblock/LC7/MglB family)